MLFNYIDYVANKLPVLNDIVLSSNSVSFVEGSSTSVNFSISIAEEGKPTDYTIQWYLNNSLLSNYNNSYSGTATFSTEGSYTLECQVTNKAGTVTKNASIIVNKISKSYSLNGGSSWVALPSNKTLTLTTSNTSYGIRFNFNASVSITAVGGGANGGSASGLTVWIDGVFAGNAGAAGGRGGVVSTKSKTFLANTSYSYTVGAANGTTTINGVSAAGGNGALAGSGFSPGYWGYAEATAGSNGTVVSALGSNYYCGSGGGGGGGMQSKNYWSHNAGLNGKSGGIGAGTGGAVSSSDGINYSGGSGSGGSNYGAGGGGAAGPYGSGGAGVRGVIVLQITN